LNIGGAFKNFLTDISLQISIRQRLKGLSNNMYDFNRKLLSGWYVSVVVVSIMIVSLINSTGTSMSYSEREQQLKRKINNPLGYKNNEVIDKIIVDRGKNQHSIKDIYNDIDKMTSYYIIVWDDNNSIKQYIKVAHDYFKKVNTGDTWDGKNSIAEDLYEDNYSLKDDKW
jgi:hypothetical protein